MLRIPRYFEYLFACLGIWFFSGNPINVLTLGSEGGQFVEDTGSNFLLPGISMMFYVLAGVILLVNWKQVIDRFLTKPQFVVLALLVGVILASTQWSAFPNYTLRRSVLVAGSSLFALFFSVRFDYRDQLKILTIGLSATVLLSLAFGLLIPQYGIMSLPPHVGAWRGVHMHKNDLGPQMAFASVFLYAVRSTRLFKGPAKHLLSFVILCAVFLAVAAKSTTAVLSLAAMAMIFVACNVLRLNYRYMAAFFTSIMTVATVGILILQTNLGEFLGIFGKGTDLSGRDEIWPAVSEMISRRPFLGYGYEGFWRGEGSPASLVWRMTGWPTPHAHNGFLDILLAIGWIGGGLFLLSFALTTVTSFKLIRLTRMTYAICPVIVLVFIMLSNITESNLFKSDVWVFYIWACFFPWAVISAQPERSQSENAQSVS